MKKKQFSKWAHWTDRNKLEGKKYPGVYAIAISDMNLSGTDFDWIKEIEYIGMTNSEKGLISRLGQFDRTIQGKNGHGGADRFRFHYPEYQPLVGKLYVAVATFPCNVIDSSVLDESDISKTTQALRVMGEVAKFEYDCFANYVEVFKRLPTYNDKKNTKKYSLENKDS